MVISLREVEESVCSCISNSAIRLPFVTSQLAADAFGGKPKCANLFLAHHCQQQMSTMRAKKNIYLLFEKSTRTRTVPFAAPPMGT